MSTLTLPSPEINLAAMATGRRDAPPVERLPLNTGATLITFTSGWLDGTVTAEVEGGPDYDASGSFLAVEVLCIYIGALDIGDAAPLEIGQHLKEATRKGIEREVEDLLQRRRERAGRPGLRSAA